MGILKDFKEQHDYSKYSIRARVTNILSPFVWYDLHKARMQRADRGWADKDTWKAGDHIARVTSEMLVYLDKEGMVDWAHWLENSAKENKNNYKDLRSIARDIRLFIEFTDTSWADGIKFVLEDKKKSIETHKIDEVTGQVITKKDIDKRIKEYTKKEKELEKKAVEAMKFVAANFYSIWD